MGSYPATRCWMGAMCLSIVTSPGSGPLVHLGAGACMPAAGLQWRLVAPIVEVVMTFVNAGRKAPPILED
jgi:hypothetical protein